MTVFGREAEIIIVDPPELEYVAREDKKIPDNYANIAIQNAKVLKGLQFTASITDDTATEGSKTRHCTLQVFNLTKDIIEILSDKVYQLRLNVGYTGQNLTNIFEGTAMSTISSRSRSGEMVTKIELREALKIVRESYVTFDNMPRETFGSKLNAIEKEFKARGAPKGNFYVSQEDLNKPLPPDLAAFEGKLAAITDKLTANFGYTWNLNQGRFSVVPKDRVTEKVTEQGKTKTSSVTKQVYKFGEDKIVGSIEPSLELNNTESASGEDVKKKKTVTFKTLLLPQLTTNNAAKIVFNDGKQLLVNIRTVTHELDFRGTNWYTNIEGAIIDA